MTTRAAVSEADVQRAVLDYLIWAGAIVIRVNSGAARPERADGSRGYVPYNRWQALGLDEQTAGISDVLALLGNVFLAIEVKRPGKTATPAQLRFLAEWTARGGVGVVVDDVQQLIDILEKKGITTR